MSTILEFLGDWWWAIVLLIGVLAIVGALNDAAAQRRQDLEHAEQERRIAAGRARAEREYQRRVEALRKAGDQ